MIGPYSTSALAADPAYLAFLRTSGLAQAQGAADYTRKTAALKAALDLRMPQLDQEHKVAQENLAGNYESRGMLRSGAYLRDNSRELAQQGRQRTGLIMDTQNQIADYGSALAASIAAQNRAAAEQGLNTANRLATNSGDAAAAAASTTTLPDATAPAATDTTTPLIQRSTVSRRAI